MAIGFFDFQMSDQVRLDGQVHAARLYGNV